MKSKSELKNPIISFVPRHKHTLKSGIHLYLLPTIEGWVLQYSSNRQFDTIGGEGTRPPQAKKGLPTTGCAKDCP